MDRQRAIQCILRGRPLGRGPVKSGRNRDGYLHRFLGAEAFSRIFLTLDRRGPDFDNATIRVHVTWEKGSSTKVKLKTNLKANRGSRTESQGDIVLAQDLSAVQFHGTTETDTLPLRFSKHRSPSSLPLDPESGTIKATIKRGMSATNKWSLHGTLSLENDIPVSSVQGDSSSMSIWAQAKLDPELLMFITWSYTKPQTGSPRGKISSPFSDKSRSRVPRRYLAAPRMVERLRVPQLPKALHVKGPIPVQWNARGRPQRLWLDMGADITAPTEWSPYLKNPRQ